jgi:hypothetical protein
MHFLNGYLNRFTSSQRIILLDLNPQSYDQEKKAFCKSNTAGNEKRWTGLSAYLGTPRPRSSARLPPRKTCQAARKPKVFYIKRK